MLGRHRDFEVEHVPSPLPFQTPESNNDLHYRAAAPLGESVRAALPNQLWRDLLLQACKATTANISSTGYPMDKLDYGLEFFFEQMDSRYGPLS
jgi:hypothetical protein